MVKGIVVIQKKTLKEDFFLEIRKIRSQKQQMRYKINIISQAFSIFRASSKPKTHG